jgi:hypothetical protein
MVLSVLDHPLVSRRYFFPSEDPPAEPFLVRHGDITLQCALERPHPDGVTVVFFHGNGEIVADYQPWLGRTLAKRGLNLLAVEYRGYGGSSGTPCLVDMLGDGEAVWRAAELEPSRTIVFGRSVGSIYALELAARQPTIRALVLESGLADLLERILLRVEPAEIGTTREELAAETQAHLDPARKLARYGGPLLVLHAAGDTLVDRSHGERLASWGTAGKTRLVLLPDGDHNSVVRANWGDYWQAFDELVAATHGAALRNIPCVAEPRSR